MEKEHDHDKMSEEEWKQHMKENLEKENILRANSPNITTKIDEAYRKFLEIKEDYGRLADWLWEQYEGYKQSTDPYWRGHRLDREFIKLKDNHPRLRLLDREYRKRLRAYHDLYFLIGGWADKLSLEEAKKTNLDEKINSN